MFSISMKMLAGDPIKVLGIIFGMTLSTALIAQQGGLFFGLMNRAQSVIAAAHDVDIWVMNPATAQFNLARPISSADVLRVHGVAGVAWAAPLIKANAGITGSSGRVRSALLLGVDDTTLAAAPRTVLVGQIDNLRRTDAVAIDRVGFRKLWPGEAVTTGKEFSINDRRAIVTVVSEAPPAFSSELIIHTRASLALDYSFAGRNRISYVLVGAEHGANTDEVANRISRVTGLRALSRQRFSEATVAYYKKNTGIVVNFATTIVLGILVGTAIVGLTFGLFVMDNIANYATLKMLGMTNARLALLVIGQVGFLAIIGFVFGIGLAAGFFELVSAPTSALRGFYLPWWVPLATFAVMLIVVIFSAAVGLWRVIAIDPELVFRGRTA
ncbi:MAG: ABC transporter permease [Hyphomicrobiaceae bacterium]